MRYRVCVCVTHIEMDVKVMAAACVVFVCIPMGNAMGVKQRIMGGSRARKDHTYVVQLQVIAYTFCAGTIIGNHWVLTAASCTMPVPKGLLWVVYGTQKLQSGGKVGHVVHVVDHPQYTHISGHNLNDIALLVIREDMLVFDFNIFIMRAQLPLPYKETPENRMQVKVLGWGYQHAEGTMTVDLQEVDVLVSSMEYCMHLYPLVDDRMFCAGRPEGGMDACRGDNGGPAVIEGHIVVGMVSFGRGCGKPHTPSVYTRVSAFLNWINSTMAEYSEE